MGSGHRFKTGNWPLTVTVTQCLSRIPTTTSKDAEHFDSQLCKATLFAPPIYPEGWFHSVCNRIATSWTTKLNDWKQDAVQNIWQIPKLSRSQRWVWKSGTGSNLVKNNRSTINFVTNLSIVLTAHFSSRVCAAIQETYVPKHPQFTILIQRSAASHPSTNMESKSYHKSKCCWFMNITKQKMERRP